MSSQARRKVIAATSCPSTVSPRLPNSSSPGGTTRPSQRCRSHRQPGTVILGRRTYDEWAGFWPDSDIEPFASFINAVPKYVATSSPLERSGPTRTRSRTGWSTSCGT